MTAHKAIKAVAQRKIFDSCRMGVGYPRMSRVPLTEESYLLPAACMLGAKRITDVLGSLKPTVPRPTKKPFHLSAI